MRFTSIWVVYNFIRLVLKHDLPTMIGEEPIYLTGRSKLSRRKKYSKEFKLDAGAIVKSGV